MEIVVLDAHTLNPGDLSWRPLEALGSCRVYPRTQPDEVLERIGDAQVVLTNKVRLDSKILTALPGLRYVGVLATGHDVVDLKAAAAQGITVTNVPAYSTPSVAQLTFALLLELTNHVGHHDGLVRGGRWQEQGEFSFFDRPLRELDGRTLGIVGLGRIGRAVARIAVAFGMDVVACSRRQLSASSAAVRFVPLQELFVTADVVSLHCPLDDTTRHLVDAPLLASMGSNALLINTSRGGLVDEAALARALHEGQIAGAGLDVLSSEPPAPDNPLLTAPNCIITPHQAWATLASRTRLLRTAVENVAAFQRGTPANVVSKA